MVKFKKYNSQYFIKEYAIFENSHPVSLESFRIYLNKKYIGNFVIISDKEGNKRFEDFYIEEEYRNKGYGQKIVKLIIKKYRKYNIILYVYNDNIIAKHIYEKYGFSIKNTEYNEVLFGIKIKNFLTFY